MGRVEIVTLRVGSRAKKERGEEKGRKKVLFPRPFPALLDSPHFLLSFGVSTWRFREQNHYSVNSLIFMYFYQLNHELNMERGSGFEGFEFGVQCPHLV